MQAAHRTSAFTNLFLNAQRKRTSAAHLPISLFISSSNLFFTSVENPPPVQIIGKYFWIADKIVPACFIERTLEIGKVSRPSPRAT